MSRKSTLELGMLSEVVRRLRSAAYARCEGDNEEEYLAFYVTAIGASGFGAQVGLRLFKIFGSATTVEELSLDLRLSLRPLNWLLDAWPPEFVSDMRWESGKLILDFPYLTDSDARPFLPCSLDKDGLWQASLNEGEGRWCIRRLGNLDCDRPRAPRVSSEPPKILKQKDLDAMITFVQSPVSPEEPAVQSPVSPEEPPRKKDE